MNNTTTATNNNNCNQPKYGKQETAAIIKSLMSGIKRYAWEYAAYYKVEYEDLIQEGVLAVLRLMNCRAREELNQAICTCLRGMIRDAADRMWRQGRAVQMSSWDDEEGEENWMEECVACTTAEEEALSVEIMADLERLLTPDEYKMAMLLREDLTLEQIGRVFSISKQAIWKRIKKTAQKIQHMKRYLN